MVQNPDFQLHVDLPTDVETLYHQFATADGIRNWWTQTCSMDQREGGKARFDFPGADFFAEVVITKLDPPQRVAWKVTDSKHPQSKGWEDLRDWIGTEIHFECEAKPDGSSTLHFAHKGLLPLECAEVCTNTWGHFLAGSLRQFLESGKGMPHPASP